MKYLLVLLVLIVAVSIWRGKRRAARAEAAPRRPALKTPEVMVACAHCGLHLPQAQALPGGGSLFYCCAEHRQAAGR